MGKVMIVEDSVATREGMRDNVPWQRHGLQLVAVAQNGRQALEAVREQLPDVVVTDIVMPEMDGIALSRALREAYPDIKVIILSAYDEFEYAQEALKSGVFDYLMKPFDYGALLQAVLGALREKEKDDRFRRQVKQSIPVLREQYLKQLVEAPSCHMLLEEDRGYLGIRFEQPLYTCVLFRIDHIKSIRQTMDMENFNMQVLRMQDAVEAGLGGAECWVFREGDNRLAAVVGLACGQDVSCFLYEKLEEIKAEVKRRCAFTITMGVCSDAVRPEDISEAYRKAADALEYRYLMGSDRIYNSMDMAAYGRLEHGGFPVEIEEALVKKVKLGSGDDAAQCVRALAQYFEAYPADREYIEAIVTGVLARVMQRIYEADTHAGRIIRTNRNIFQKLQDFDDSAQMFEWLQETIEHICGEVRSGISQHYLHITNQVEEYIAKTYMDEELGLLEIAKQVGLSPTYLSAVYKKQTRVNISEYIQRVRLEKAQELLRLTDMRVSEVSAAVGYTNPFYFSTSFKKYTGKTPIQFRQQCT